MGSRPAVGLVLFLLWVSLMTMLTLLFLLACGPKTPPVEVAPDAPPVLPSPDGARYATGPSDPRDPLVLAAVSGMPWQESLAGAATALALDTSHTPELGLARWAAIRSGYPHPVRALLIGTAKIGEIPESFLEEVRTVMLQGDELGLVRARAGSTDRWVALIGRPRMAVAAFEREIPLGGTLEVDGEVGAPWVLMSPSGVMRTGSLPLREPLDEGGEWWLEIRRGQGVAISVPVFVDMPTPPAPILELPGEAVSRPMDAVSLTYALIEELRASFQLAPLAPDATLETLAIYPLELAVDEVWDHSAGLARLQGAGFVGGPVGQVFCEARTVALCMDSMMWDMESRRAILTPGVRVLGAAAVVRTSGVSLLINFASE